MCYRQVASWRNKQGILKVCAGCVSVVEGNWSLKWVQEAQTIKL